jgi:hypothetical protein
VEREVVVEGRQEEVAANVFQVIVAPLLLSVAVMTAQWIVVLVSHYRLKFVEVLDLIVLVGRQD